MKSLERITKAPDQTEAVAEQIGRNLRGGEVIELKSDLGGGKTTFVRGLARGFGSKDKVASPTFTISKQYKSGDKLLVHYDFYRLPEAGLMRHELEETIDDPRAVIVVEWGDVVADVLPQNRLSIHIAATGEESRKLTMTFPAEVEYLVGGLQ